MPTLHFLSGVGLFTTATIFGAPVGALVVANGVDNFQAGLRQLITGEQTNTLLYDATKRLTGSDKLAGTVDFATGFVLNTATASAAAQRAAAVADARVVAAEAADLRQQTRALINVAESQQARQGSGFAAFSQRAKALTTESERAAAAEFGIHPSTPVGRKGSPMDVTPGTNTPSNIGGRDYTGHALDQMQGRGLNSSVVENAIQNGQSIAGKIPGTTAHYDSVNNVTVITDTSSGRVVTAAPGKIKQ